MRLRTLLALTGLAALASTTPVTPAVPHPLPQVQPRKPAEPRQDDVPACAKVSQAIYEVKPRASQVPAALAWDCINSVPLNVSSAKRLLKGLPVWLEWQSTLDALKNPPAEYVEKVQPPIDILSALKQIEGDIDAGRFKSEYDFGWILYTLFVGAHDGHLSFVPDSVGGVFNWGRPVPLVSVSADGTQLPAVFAYYDVLGMQFKNISYTPSPVVEIDGQDATLFLEQYSLYGSLQDRDALYNNMFYELAQISLGSYGSGVGLFAGGGRGRFAYPGDTTTLKFANGTEYTMQNYARVVATNFRNISTGEDLARNMFYYDTPDFASTQNAPVPVPIGEAETVAAAAVPPGYPAPAVAGPGNLIDGFYINAAGYEDVAILKVSNFVSDRYSEIPFQQLTKNFLPKAIADGKTKLIIDLQANGGGTIMQGFDMFKQLFPDQHPYSGNRFRYNEGADLIGQSFSAISSEIVSGVRNGTLISVQSSWFDYHFDLTDDGKPFDSWQQKIGPVEVDGAKYSTVNQWDFSTPYIQYISGGINVTGYGQLANVTGPPKFKPENIVLLTDGYCASTCSIFSELMTEQVGVKTIAMGGRANKNPIQAIGGVKGVNNFPFSFVQGNAKGAIQLAPANMTDRLANSVLKAYNSNLVVSRAYGTPGINARDGLRKGDDSGTALQFIYQEADCRLYYTPEMTVDATAIWKAAADSQWGGKGKCVGSGSSGAALAAGDSVEVTTELNAGRVAMSQAGALHSFEAFEKTFGLETDCHLVADGFMQP